MSGPLPAPLELPLRESQSESLLASADNGATAVAPSAGSAGSPMGRRRPFPRLDEPVAGAGGAPRAGSPGCVVLPG